VHIPDIADEAEAHSGLHAKQIMGCGVVAAAVSLPVVVLVVVFMAALDSRILY